MTDYDVGVKDSAFTVLSGFLAKKCKYKLIVEDGLTVKKLDALSKILSLQRQFLLEDQE